MKTQYWPITPADDGTAELPIANSPPINAHGYQDVTVGADSLAGAEKVDVYILVGTAYKQLYDEQAVPVAVTLTATRNARNLIGNNTYALAKGATTATAGKLWYSMGAPNPR